MMKRDQLGFLRCPECSGDLIPAPDGELNGQIISGALSCRRCERSYAVRGGVPRFVEQTTYARTFGAQWKAYARTQIDGEGSRESEDRWRTEIGWSPDDLAGRAVVEFGSGAGRFIDVASRYGAGLVVGMDITDAVDAAQDNLGNRDNVLFVQGDAFNPPFVPASFDFAYSIGVLHHTPDPENAFRKMVGTVRAGGRVGLSLYEISLYDRPNRNSLHTSTMELLWALNMWRAELFRQVTTRVPQECMLAYCRRIIPVLHEMNKVPLLRIVRYLLPSTCYRDKPVEWSMLDTHDTYATKIVHQYRHKEIFQWFLRAGLTDIIVHDSRAGWVSLTGRKPEQ